MSSGFVGVSISDGELLSDISTGCGARFFGISSQSRTLDFATNTVLCVDGTITVVDSHGAVFLTRGMYAVIPTDCEVKPVNGLAVIISFPDAEGFRQFGGPLEQKGRLTYIDGCTDTLLVCPPRLGAPCLNHLHIPPATNQSFHTHPSDRLGVILDGSGWCDTPDGTLELQPGLAWFIPAGCIHRFRTDSACLDVIAWHPDSDFGPTDNDHPMINRTLLG